MDNRPIGVFDSGVGGLSFLRYAVGALPDECFIYFGDSQNAPYGTKSQDEVLELSFKNTQILIDKGAKAIVIACNTATSISVEKLRESYDIPIISMEPAIKPALEKTSGNVLLMATQVTLNSSRVHSLIERYDTQHRVIKVVSARLAELIEKSPFENADIDGYLHSLLDEYKNEDITAVVLGCTHYPFVAQRIKRILTDTVVFDGIEGTVLHLKEILNSKGLENSGGEERKIIISSSKNDEKTKELYNRLFTGGFV